MTLITIRQIGNWQDQPNVELSFDGQPGYPLTVRDPFSAAEEEQLAWYFERHLRFPFTDQVRAQTAAASIQRYGQGLFHQLFAQDETVYAHYRRAVAQGGSTLRFQISGGPSFHQLHWEALWDPALPHPFVLAAPLIRTGNRPADHPLTVQQSPTLNLLLVTARPQGRGDVSYRTIQRPLLEMLRQSQLPVQVDLVRPGSYQALVDHLRGVRGRHGVGYYHIIHFDLHGAVLTPAQLAALGTVSEHSYEVRLRERYARPDLAISLTAGETAAYLFFEDEKDGNLDPATAGEIAGLLLEHHIPIAILNACQSGQETGDPETSLGSRLLQAGVQTVVAMSYSVTVSAATRLMQALYQELFRAPHDLLAAIAAGRTALHHAKQRRAYFNQQIQLEDWLLPVVYQPGPNAPATLPLRPMTFEEQVAFYARDAARYTPPEPEYGFVGRDIDILAIERRLLSVQEGKRRNLLLIQGMGGAGKSTLLRHLAGWWQRSGLVGEVFYFGYDEKAHTLHQIVDTVARTLLNRHIPAGATVSGEFAAFQAMQLAVQARLLAQKLRGERHLLILDNLESVTGDPLAIPNTLPLAEQRALRGWLAELLDGATLVLLGSRGEAGWLQGGFDPSSAANPPLRRVDCYPLPGLDEESASDLAQRIVQRQVPERDQQQRYRADPAFRQLLKLLDGSPLALEVVLSNLKRQTPSEILHALQAGDVGLDSQTLPQPSPNAGGSRTFGKGIPSPHVDQASSTLTVDETTVPPPSWGRLGGGDKTRSILACIAYAHSNLDAAAQQLLLCLFPFTGVIWADQLANYAKHLVTLSPGLPVSQFPAVLQAAQDWGLLTPHELPGYLRLQPVLPYFLKTRLAQEPMEVRAAIETAFRLHYDELAEALFNLFEAKEPQQRQTARLLTQVEYENLTTALQRCLADRAPFFDLYAVLGHYLDSVQDHRRGVELGQSILDQMAQYPPEMRFGTAASGFLRVLGELGSRQMTLKQYGQAEARYQAAAQFIEQITNVSAATKGSWQATVYHQLGMVAQEQRQWAQAEQHYQHALALFIEFNDRYSQARTYHQLGIVAQAQRQWAQAEQHYQHALALFIEFNDRYSQASTYHQLGMVAEEQEQWSQAYAYYLKDLEITVEYNDAHGLEITRSSLRRLWQAHPDETALATIAGLLGLALDEVRGWLTAADD